jgi:hypothetical protein
MEQENTVCGYAVDHCLRLVVFFGSSGIMGVKRS